MKKVIFIILYFVVSVTLFSENIVSGYAEVGYINFDYLWGDDADASGSEDPLTYVDINLELNYLCMFIGGNVVNYQWKTGPKKFNVAMTDYTVYFGFKFQVRETFLSIGFRHSCGHPVVSGRDPLMSINRTYEQIYAKIEF